MSKALVAYFSVSGITARLAERLASAIGADLHEIQPAQKYTAEDLDWTNKKSRSSVEMNDKSFRPAIADKVENMDQYDVIYLGFPIWWYVAPTIINTFLEAYNLEGKKLYPLQHPAAVEWEGQMWNWKIPVKVLTLWIANVFMQMQV